MKVVNRVFRSRLSASKVNFSELKARCEAQGWNYKWMTYRPIMFTIRRPGFTVIVFESGKCRIMGSINLDDARQKLSSTLNDPNCAMELQTVTVILNMEKSLPRAFHDLSRSAINYEPELFPAFHVNEWKNIHVNVFSTGKVVIMGKAAEQMAPTVQDWLVDRYEAAESLDFLYDD